MAAMHDHGQWCPKIAELVNWMASESLCPSTCADSYPPHTATPIAVRPATLQPLQPYSPPATRLHCPPCSLEGHRPACTALRHPTPGTRRSSRTNATPAGCSPPRPRQRPRPRRLPSPRSSAAVRRASGSTEHLCAAAVYFHERTHRHCTFPPVLPRGAALGLPPGGSLPTSWSLPRSIASADTTHSALLVHPFVRAVPSHG